MLLRLLVLAQLAAGAALAGDLSAPAPLPTPAAPAAAVPAAPPVSRDWIGGYLGVELTYGSGDSHGLFGEDSSTGGFYGAVAGYRFDAGRVVVGGEVTYSRTDITFPDGTDIDNLLRAGMSVGYDLGRYLPYVAGGYANVSLINDPLDFDDTYHGGFYGAGIAYRVTDHLILSGDILRHRFDAEGPRAGLVTFAGRLSYRF